MFVARWSCWLWLSMLLISLVSLVAVVVDRCLLLSLVVSRMLAISAVVC